MKAIYNPKLKAIPCKDGAYRRLCDMTPAQLAEEGYDEMGEPLPKVPVTRHVKINEPIGEWSAGDTFILDYDEPGERLPKVEPAGDAIDRFVGDRVVREYRREFRVKTLKEILNEIHQAGRYNETVNKTDADFNNPRQLHNCDTCGNLRAGHYCDILHPDRNRDAQTRVIVAEWAGENWQNKMNPNADNCPGWKERE